MSTPHKYTEPNKELENLYISHYLTPQNQQPLNESVSNPVLGEDDGLGIPDSDFDALFESIVDPLNEEFAQTEVGAEDEPQVSPQGDGRDDLSEFDDGMGEEGGEEEMITLPIAQLRGLFDVLKAHFEGGDEGGEEGGDDLGGGEDIMSADDENNFSNDELPTESRKPKAKKKFIDSKSTGFQSKAKVKSPQVKPVKFDKSPKVHTAKSKLMKPDDKNWV